MQTETRNVYLTHATHMFSNRLCFINVPHTIIIYCVGFYHSLHPDVLLPFPPQVLISVPQNSIQGCGGSRGESFPDTLLSTNSLFFLRESRAGPPNPARPLTGRFFATDLPVLRMILH